MVQSIRPFFSLMLTVVLFMLGAGYFVSFQSLVLKTNGYSEIIVGIVQSAYYAGLLLGSIKVEPFIHRLGHAKALAIFTSVSAISIMVQGLIPFPFFWVLLRFLGGFCLGGVYVVVESWLLEKSNEMNRGQILSIYLVTLYVSQACGQFLINFVDIQTLQPYIAAGLLCISSVIPILLSKAELPHFSQPIVKKISTVFKESPFGFMGCIISGMILSALYSFVPNFAQDQGLSPAYLMSVTIFGGVLLQWPIGKLSDIFDRKKLLIVTSLTGLIPCLLMLFIPELTFLTYVFSFVLGGLTFTLYPISLTLACEGINSNSLTSMTAVLLLAYGIGAVIGPLIAPLFMIDPFGISGLYIFVGFMTLSLSIIGFIGNRATVGDEI